jgi:hypothetical protein
MGKMFGILMIVVALWVGLEVYQNGTDGAFGGALAGLTGSSEERQPGERRPVPQRAGAAVERAHTAANARRERLLGD